MNWGAGRRTRRSQLLLALLCCVLLGISLVTPTLAEVKGRVASSAGRSTGSEFAVTGASVDTLQKPTQGATYTTTAFTPPGPSSVPPPDLVFQSGFEDPVP